VDRVVRLGIIGCGRVAEERHLPPLLKLPEIRVVATADLDKQRSVSLAIRRAAGRLRRPRGSGPRPWTRWRY
jgi:predicted dehydrogenase